MYKNQKRCFKYKDLNKSPQNYIRKQSNDEQDSLKKTS